ncbi:MAG: DUF488 family protein [Candidatus Njordarchaeota archaeon]
MNKRVVYTLGHSNREWGEFVDILKKYRIDIIADVRRFPSSKKFPHFNKDTLQRALGNIGIGYIWLKNLGGYRGYIKGSEKYKCFRARGYRNYVAWMQHDEWKKDFSNLVNLCSKNIVAIMCAEKFYWRCHRKLISDALLALGLDVIHIINLHKTIPHKLTKCARIINGSLVYI